MATKLKKIIILSLVLVFFINIIACVPKTYRAHPEFEIRSKNIKTIQLISPDVDVYELTAGGIDELRDDWCIMGEENVLKAINEELKDAPVVVQNLPINQDLEKELEDIQALYRAVSKSIQLHTYEGPNLFPEKKKNFDYSIGSIQEIVQSYGVDALIFVYGIDEISTTGRKALQTTGILIGVFTGIVIAPRFGITAVSIAVVDKSGTILWYNVEGSHGGHDLREYESANDLVEEIIVDCPLFKK